MEIRTKAIVFFEEGIRSAKEIRETYNISERTVRRWAQNHRNDPENGLKPKKTGPRRRSRKAIPALLEQRIIRLKGKYPAWGARRIKHQFNLPCSWRTVHRILKKHGLLIRIKPKPQPAGKRFQRQHVDSMWQGDIFQFRSAASEKCTSPGSLMTAPGIASRARSTCTRMPLQPLMPFSGHFVPAGFPERSISITANNSSQNCSKQKQKNTVSNLFSDDLTILAAAGRSSDITRRFTGNLSSSKNSVL